MPVTQEELETALRDAIPIDYLEIKDTSSGCGQNYAIVVVSPAFEGKLTLARHRMINELLKAQIAQMHAFSQKSYTPKQWAAEQAKKEAAAMEKELETTVAASDPPVTA
ncbi:bola-like protein [Serendipita vermifera]|nr:bola-like protein [Serendipita vermifera]